MHSLTLPPRSDASAAGTGHGQAHAIEVRGLTRRFGARTVLDRIDLTIGAGERAGLWGPNGSGKTTLLRCLAGTLTPSAGRAFVLGHPSGSRAARRALGVCLGQERAFYGRLSARENLLFAARLRMRPGSAAPVRWRRSATSWNWGRSWNGPSSGARRACERGWR